MKKYTIIPKIKDNKKQINTDCVRALIVKITKDMIKVANRYFQELCNCCNEP